MGWYCGIPKALHWALAALMNSVVVTLAVGIPCSSK
jgi:hypothetical protein